MKKLPRHRKVIIDTVIIDTSLKDKMFKKENKLYLLLLSAKIKLINDDMTQIFSNSKIVIVIDNKMNKRKLNFSI